MGAKSFLSHFSTALGEGEISLSKPSVRHALGLQFILIGPLVIAGSLVSHNPCLFDRSS
jgi:hypothetical protein